MNDHIHPLVRRLLSTIVPPPDPAAQRHARDRYVRDRGGLPVAHRLPSPAQERGDKIDAAHVAAYRGRFDAAYAEPHHRRALERMLDDAESMNTSNGMELRPRKHTSSRFSAQAHSSPRRPQSPSRRGM